MGLEATGDVEAAMDKAMEVLADRRLRMLATGLEVSLITRCPNGVGWPVLKREVGQNRADIEAARNGKS